MQVVERSSDVAGLILSWLKDYDLAVVGMSARIDDRSDPLGPILGRVLAESRTAVMAVCTAPSIPVVLEGERIGQSAISVLVDKCFAENTFTGRNCSDRFQFR